MSYFELTAPNSGYSIGINSYRDLQQYFDYTQLLEKVIDDNSLRRNLVNFLNETSHDGSNLLRILGAAPEKFFTEDPKSPIIKNGDRLANSPNEPVEIDPENLVTRYGCKDAVCNEQLKEIAYISMNRKQAWELLLFCELFDYVEKCFVQADLDLLKKRLNLNESQLLQRSIQRTQEYALREPTALPFCSDIPGKPFSLKLGVIRNPLKEAATVTLDGTTIRRTLAPGSRLLVLLSSDGEVVSFLPRFCVARNQVLYQEGCHLKSTGSPGDSVDLNTDGIVFFSESNQYGLLIADQEGTFQKIRFTGEAPQEKVCWMVGAYAGYGFLSSQGRYFGACALPEWEGRGLLSFDISVENGIAITADRKTINSKGDELCENAAAVSCCGNRYIVLRTDGSVFTDQGELESTAIAVCADSSGYWISTGKTVRHYLGSQDASCDFVGDVEEAVEEIIRDNAGSTVFGFSSGESAIPLR